MHLLPGGACAHRRPQVCHHAQLSGGSCRACGWDAVFADIPALEFFDEDSGRLSGRLHACPTECNEDRLVWNDWQHHQVKRKRAADADGTFGASDAYKVTFWGPTVGTRRLFFQHARRCLNDYVRHAWALHNDRIVNKLFKYVFEVGGRTCHARDVVGEC